MGKAKRNRKNNSDKTAAKKQQRQAYRKAKDAATDEQGNMTITMPIWHYPLTATSMAAQDPDVTYEAALEVLLEYPVSVSRNSQPPGVMVPAEAILEAGVTTEEFIGSLEEMHRNGLLTWDPLARIHHMFPNPSESEAR